MWKRQQAVTGSKLTFHEGLLTWTPVGLHPKDPGGAPFQLQVGRRPGQVQELVWVYGTVAIGARGGSMDAGAVAVCTQDPTSPGGRRVLAYLPEALIALPMGEVAVPDEAAARARARAIADGIGVSFAVHEAELGEDPNVLFPGVMRFGRFGKRMAWAPSVIYLAFGVVFVSEGGYQLAQGQWATVFFFGFGLVMAAVGAVALPPVSNAIRKRSAMRHTK